MVLPAWDTPDVMKACVLVWAAVVVVGGLVYYAATVRWDREDAEGRRKARLRDLVGGGD